MGPADARPYVCVALCTRLDLPSIIFFSFLGVFLSLCRKTLCSLCLLSVSLCVRPDARTGVRVFSLSYRVGVKVDRIIYTSLLRSNRNKVLSVRQPKNVRRLLAEPRMHLSGCTYQQRNFITSYWLLLVYSTHGHTSA